MEEGKPFQIYKFRSMVSGAEEDGVARWAAQNDPRITRVGSVLRKGRLDELPQLINILKGDMSFRRAATGAPPNSCRCWPINPYYEERLRVKPVTTGTNYSYGNKEVG